MDCWPPLTRRACLVALAGVLGAACRRRGGRDGAPRVEELEVASHPAGWLALPNAAASVKLAVIGDAGRGTRPQHEVAQQMAAYHARFAFPLVLMLGDNIYEGPARPRDYQLKFEEPYASLRAAGVQFRAVLGNHDDPAQRFYAPFGMGGQRYYTFEPPGPRLSRLVDAVRILALDSTNLDGDQLAWLRRELGRSRARWTLCMLHHPLYTGGRYRGRAYYTRWQIESLLVEHGVDVVLSGHEHIYQRSTPQGGIVHFISGAGGSLREGDATASADVARAFDRDYHFMLMEIVGRALHFQAISRAGLTIDAGVIRKE